MECAVGYPRSQASQTRKEWPGIHCLCKCNYPYKNLGIQWNHLIYLEIVCIIISIHPVLSSKMAASEKAFDLFNSLANLLSKCRTLEKGTGSKSHRWECQFSAVSAIELISYYIEDLDWIWSVSWTLQCYKSVWTTTNAQTVDTRHIFTWPGNETSRGQAWRVLFGCLQLPSSTVYNISFS